MSEAPIWELFRGDELVARLVVESPDFPWLRARVQALPGFADLRPLFAEEVRLLQAADEPGAGLGPDSAWEHAYWRIRDAVRLVDPDGRDVPEFLLHIDDDEAWWRWHDQPFDPPTA